MLSWQAGNGKITHVKFNACLACIGAAAPVRPSYCEILNLIHPGAGGHYRVTQSASKIRVCLLSTYRPMVLQLPEAINPSLMRLPPKAQLHSHLRTASGLFSPYQLL